MTDLEADQFVTDEIASRYKSLPEATRGDWIRAVKRADHLPVARRIVREIVDDPDATLCVRAFHKRLKANGGNGRPEGKATFLVREDADFDVFAVATWPDGRPWWTMRITYPTHRCYENGVVKPISWTAEKLMDGMQRTLREIRETYGGEWFLKIEKAKPEPAPQIGRGVMGLRPLAAGLADKMTPPPEPPLKRVASRQDIERVEGAQSTTGSTESIFKPLEPRTLPEGPVQGDRPAETKPGAFSTSLAGRLRKSREPGEDDAEEIGPTRFDPEHDPELQGDI